MELATRRLENDPAKGACWLRCISDDKGYSMNECNQNCHIPAGIDPEPEEEE